MGKRKGFARDDIPATLPRRLAEKGEGRKRLIKGGNALCQVVSAWAISPGEDDCGPAGLAGTNVSTAQWIERWCGKVGAWRPTCEVESLAFDRRSKVWVGNVRLNNGRGSMIFDAVCLDSSFMPTPVTLKGGKTASDIALGKALEVVRQLVEAGAPLWLGIVDGPMVGDNIPYESAHPDEEGHEVYLPEVDFRHVRVQWVNLTPLLRTLPAWDRECQTPCGWARIRAEERECKVADGVVGNKTYLRLNVALGKLRAGPETFHPVSPGGVRIPGHGW